MMDMEQLRQTLGQRIVSAAELATAAHLDHVMSGFGADPDVRRFRQRLMAGGAGLAAVSSDAAACFTEEALPPAAMRAARSSVGEASQPSSSRWEEGRT
jgi:hypothetical protein